jgi:hypothetical protein
MKRFALAASAAAMLLSIPPSAADADIIRACAKKSGGPLTLLAGKQKCRKGEKEFKLERPMGSAVDGSAEVPPNAKNGECHLLAEFLGGEIAFCLGNDHHDSYGSHCFMWVYTEHPLERLGSYGHGDPIKLGTDEVNGIGTDDPDYRRGIVTFADPEIPLRTGAFLGMVSEGPEAGFVVEAKDVLMVYPRGEDCRGYGRFSGRYR